jgi:hypothetical protein
MAETTDGFVVMTGMSAIVKRTKLGQFVTSKDYNPFLVQVGPVLPLPGGQVLEPWTWRCARSTDP